MKKQRYVYQGPLSVSTLYATQGGKQVAERVRFVPGAELDLPAEHPVIRSLVARGRLELVQSAAAPVPRVPKAPKGDSSKGDSTAKGDK